MANNTLITGIDVKEAVDLAHDFDIAKINKALLQIEYYKFNNIAELGLDLYNSMKEDRITYPLLPAYSHSTTYAINDKVVYGGKNRISLQNANVGKMNSAVELDWWGDCPIFTNATYIAIWPHLVRYIGLEVLKNILASATYSAGEKGATKYSEDFRGRGTGISTVSKEEFLLLKSSIISNAEMALSNLLSVMYELNANTNTATETGFENMNAARRIGRRIFIKSKSN